MTDYKSRFLKKLCLYENGKFLEVDFTPDFVSEEEVDLYQAKKSEKQIPIEFKSKNKERLVRRYLDNSKEMKPMGLEYFSIGR